MEGREGRDKERTDQDRDARTGAERHREVTQETDRDRAILKEKENMKFFDFFAGIGGFRLGMEMAGHECVGHCEIDKFANMSYMAMHKPKESEVYFGDVRTINPWDMPECDIYCGGFPCQSFSIAGKRRGFEDIRGTLFFEIMRIAKERHPKYLFLENVKGLLNHDGGGYIPNHHRNNGGVGV